MVRPSSVKCNPSVGWRAEYLHLAAAGQRPPERDFVRVLQVAADRQAAGQPRHAHASAQAVGDVSRGRLARHVRIRGEHDLLHAVPFNPSNQLVDAQMLGVDAVDRGECAAEDVVEAAELARPLDREKVDGLLDDADQRVVAPCIAADRAHLFLREVAALVAKADPFLHVFDRRGERERFVLRPLEQVEREPVGRPRPDPRKAGELRDEIFDSGAEHLSYSADMPRISEVALFTEDVSRLAAFYEELLGRPADSRSDSHASFELGATTLFIHVAGDGADHEGAPNSDHVAFALDQDAAADRVRAAGTDVVGPKDFYWGRSAYLRDPDGRAVELQADS